MLSLLGCQTPTQYLIKILHSTAAGSLSGAVTGAAGWIKASGTFPDSNSVLSKVE